MTPKVFRAAAALGLALLLAGCDKCGGFSINMPGASAPTSCSDTRPRG